MSVPEIDIYRTAKIIIDQYGDGALLEAMKRQELYAASGNSGGERIWSRIANAVESLQVTENMTSETVQ